MSAYRRIIGEIAFWAFVAAFWAFFALPHIRY